MHLSLVESSIFMKNCYAYPQYFHNILQVKQKKNSHAFICIFEIQSPEYSCIIYAYKSKTLMHSHVFHNNFPVEKPNSHAFTIYAFQNTRQVIMHSYMH